MSDQEEGEQCQEKPFYVDRAKTGRAGCKKCKQKIDKGELRFAKLGYNPFGSGTIKMWHHIPCMFEVFKKQRESTRKIESPDDIGGWFELSESDKEEIMSYFSPELKKIFESYTGKNSQVTPTKIKTKDEDVDKSFESKYRNHKDNTFRAFRKLCSDLSNDSSYLTKTKIVSDFFEKGSDGDSFKGNVELWVRLLLPGAIVRVYNLQSKQLVKLFSRILGTSHEEMLEDLEKGDVAETISTFFEKSSKITPATKSVLTLQEVDEFLEQLSKLTKEDDQSYHFKKIIKKCTTNDLKMILRLIKHDLRINAGPKHVLEGLHKDAYKAFQTSRDLKSVVSNALKTKGKKEVKTNEEKQNKAMSIGINLMTPVLPMLAQPCKSVQMALKKCPNGLYSEIKYDGERVQVHKREDTFKYFSRSLKPVMAHKVSPFKDYIPQAFPHGKDMILDAEVLMVDNDTGKLLPFGTLGIHKKSEFSNANVCLFIFDCLYFNGRSLLETKLKERKEILRKNIVEVKNHIMLSEMKEIHQPEDLEKMIDKTFKLGLEGLVLKDVNSFYLPGKRHWLKVKKDYLNDGAMADSADLVVLGAWFGTGSKGGIMSSFLMGCYDSTTNKWVTVTKVSGGHDDATLDKLQKELMMIKISKDPSKLPKWLNCTKTMIPDFVAADPKKMPVWEITGAEFTCNQVHTASGISIRFPRVTKIRSDKDWSTATSLTELKDLYKKSKEPSDFNLNRNSSTGTKSVEEEEEEDDDDDDDDDDDEKEKEKSKKAKKRKKTTDNNKKTEKNSKKPKLDEDENSDAYEEDTETDSENACDDVELTESALPNPLPNVFTNCVIQLPKEHKDYNFLRRYLIAYDAVLHDSEKNSSRENSKDKVTHVIHVKGTTNTTNGSNCWSKAVRHVHINWIWDSIKLLEKQPESRYTVTVKS